MVPCQARDSRAEVTPEEPLCYLPSRLQLKGAVKFCLLSSLSAEMSWHFSLLLSCYFTTLLSGQQTWPVDSRKRIVVQSQDTDNPPSLFLLVYSTVDMKTMVSQVLWPQVIIPDIFLRTDHLLSHAVSCPSTPTRWSHGYKIGHFQLYLL